MLGALVQTESLTHTDNEHIVNLPIRQLAIATALAVTLPAAAQSCTGDIFANGVVNGADLGAMLSYWGPRTRDPFSVASDINGDGIINGGDLGALLANWGPCPASISGITPTEGCFVGGTVITITGAYLGTATEVTIGGVPATIVTANSPTTIAATTPAGVLGPATVFVTTATGTYAAPQTFTYMPASVSSIAPNTGTTAGGFQITITGEYLALTTGVTIGGTPCTGVTVVNATTVTAMTPAGTLGNADVVISGGKGTITVVGGYRYGTVVVPSWATLVETQPDPAVVTDVTLRAAIAATGLAWRVRDTATQMEMLLVPPGPFTMGEAGWIEPVHPVTLTQAFYMGRYEVTQGQWVARMGSNPSYTAKQPDSANRPVEQVSWNNVQGYMSATGMRLASEAEWEYACRAGTTTAFNNGSSDDATVVNIAWYRDNSGVQPNVVGGKAANALGLHDMAGNVWEWVNDWYDSNYYSVSPLTNPLGPVSGASRVNRGGCFNSTASHVRSSYRNWYPPDYTFNIVGFRVARNP
jgi:formylglycine-generating enzyme required for sulfatase activity